MTSISKWIVALIIGCLSVLSEEKLIAQSLYDEKNYQAVAADKKAFRVGDTLAIIVVESSRAESSAATGSKRNSRIAANIFDTSSQHNAGVDVNAASGGDAVTARAGFVSAQLAVRVISVSETGLLSIKGEQIIVINGEEQKILISGDVRRTDISKSNSLYSNRLIDAKIKFSGKGVVGREQETGLIYRVLGWLGLI